MAILNKTNSTQPLFRVSATVCEKLPCCNSSFPEHLQESDLRGRETESHIVKILPSHRYQIHFKCMVRGKRKKLR